MLGESSAVKSKSRCDCGLVSALMWATCRPGIAQHPHPLTSKEKVYSPAHGGSLSVLEA
jgi:hypothetical protein